MLILRMIITIGTILLQFETLDIKLNRIIQLFRATRPVPEEEHAA